MIGEPLPMAKIKAGISELKLTKNVGLTKAILTTDTHPKTMTVKCVINDQPVTITGFCKGSGMIHPNMATMLGFVTTDAVISGSQLQQLLSHTVDETFNQITVDGDTSTNDMVVVMANGQAHNQPLTDTNPDYSTFAVAFETVLAHLAKEIAGDGEGASKLVEVNVKGALNHLEGQQVAKAIVGSNLVKAMILVKMVTGAESCRQSVKPTPTLTLTASASRLTASNWLKTAWGPELMTPKFQQP